MGIITIIISQNCNQLQLITITNYHYNTATLGVKKACLCLSLALRKNLVGTWRAILSSFV